METGASSHFGKAQASEDGEAPQASHNYSTSSLQREKKSPNMYLKGKGVFETSFVTFILVLYLWSLDKTKNLGHA